MTPQKRFFAFPVMGLFIVFFIIMASSIPAREPGRIPIADINMGSSSIYWQPNMGYGSAVLNIACPDGSVFSRTFQSIATPSFDLSDLGIKSIIDGSYTYELRLLPQVDKKAARSEKEMMGMPKGPGRSPARVQTLTGYFRVQVGQIVTRLLGEEPMLPITGTINEDQYVIGSQCIGTDCSNPETWGYDVVRLKENNLRLHFDDTSSTSSFPANDWRMVINDTADGGADYFAIEDATAGENVFTIEAGAPENSLYVEDYGRIGLKTSTPAVELHIVDGDSPAVRLEQDTSSGWTAQSWDVVGNESNFFIRDVTNSSKLPFRIQPGTPSSTLCLKSDGKVGIGTWSPAYKVDVQTTGENCVLVVNRTDGASNYINATATYANFGSVNNFPTRIAVNSIWRARFNTDNSLTMANGASCTVGGVWTNASSISLKENIQDLSTQEAVETLNNLNPVKYNYKADKEERHVGFIAEDVPDMVASKDRKGMSPMDVTAVLTQVVKEQQKMIQEQKEIVRELQKMNREQQQVISELKDRVGLLEKK